MNRIKISALLCIVIALSLLLCACENNTLENTAWGDGITQGIPAFSAEIYSISADESHCAAYYINVTTEQVNQYISQLESSLNVKFSGEKYPKSISFEDRIITLHYNVTEMRFSVTITK